MFSKMPSAIETVNDIDSEITNLFRCIQIDSERLARLVMTTPYSREGYDNCFEHIEINFLSRFQKAAMFLVRCWQSHGFRANFRKVGWKNDVQGRESMYALWDWYRLPEWIIEVAERLRKVQIEHANALQVIKRFDYENVFMYLDPPYLMKARVARQKQYTHEMTDSDHEELLSIICNSKAKIMISGYESDMYNHYLLNWKKREFNSCAGYGSARKEIIWMNYEQDKQMSFEDFPEVMQKQGGRNECTREDFGGDRK